MLRSGEQPNPLLTHLVCIFETQKEHRREVVQRWEVISTRYVQARATVFSVSVREKTVIAPKRIQTVIRIIIKDRKTRPSWASLS